MAINELNPAVGQAIPEQTPDVAEFLQRVFQSAALLGRMPPPVIRVRHKITGANGCVAHDTISNIHGFSSRGGWHALSLRRACFSPARPSKTQGVPPGHSPILTPSPLLDWVAAVPPAQPARRADRSTAPATLSITPRRRGRRA